MKEVQEDESEIDVRLLHADHPFRKFDNIDKSARDDMDRKTQEDKKKADKKKKKSPS